MERQPILNDNDTSMDQSQRPKQRQGEQLIHGYNDVIFLLSWEFQAGAQVGSGELHSDDSGKAKQRQQFQA